MAHVPNSAEQYEKMIGTPIPQLVSSLAIPTTISMLVTVIYNTADTYFVSQINKSASAAVGMVYTLMAILQAVGYGLGMGAGSFVSRCISQGILKLYPALQCPKQSDLIDVFQIPANGNTAGNPADLDSGRFD